jgi:hypothetical protein
MLIILLNLQASSKFLKKKKTPSDNIVEILYCKIGPKEVATVEWNGQQVLSRSV